MRSMRMLLALIAAGTLTVSCAPKVPPAALISSYELDGCCTYAAIVDKARLSAADELEAVGRHVCRDVNTNGCFVRVYINDREAPTPGADVETAMQSGRPDFVYNRNYKTGLDQPMWNCSRFPTGFTADQCLGGTMPS